MCYTSCARDHVCIDAGSKTAESLRRTIKTVPRRTCRSHVLRCSLLELASLAPTVQPSVFRLPDSERVLES